MVGCFVKYVLKFEREFGFILTFKIPAYGYKYERHRFA